MDSRASDHMSGDAIHDYSPQKGNTSIRIIDGSLSTILGTSSIQLTKDIRLSSCPSCPEF